MCSLLVVAHLQGRAQQRLQVIELDSVRGALDVRLETDGKRHHTGSVSGCEMFKNDETSSPTRQTLKGLLSLLL